MSSVKKIEKLEREILEQYRIRLDAVQKLCDSEIEKLFFLNIINYYESAFDLDVKLNYICEPPDFHLVNNGFSYKNRVQVSNREGAMFFPIGIRVETALYEFELLPQYEVILNNRQYRLDFLLHLVRSDNSVVKLCIECDGFNFHGRNIEQVNYDNQRQNDLIANDFLVFRYSGSEVYQISSFEAFTKVIDQIFDLAKVMRGSEAMEILSRKKRS